MRRKVEGLFECLRFHDGQSLKTSFGMKVVKRDGDSDTIRPDPTDSSDIADFKIFVSSHLGGTRTLTDPDALSQLRAQQFANSRRCYHESSL